MDKQELQIIQELMEVLQDKMQFGEDDLSERLGRQKPEVEVMKIEGKSEGDPMLEGAEAESGMDLDADKEMSMEDEFDDSPEAKLKRRIMQMRG